MKGILEIAQRFNAGLRFVLFDESPGGTTEVPAGPKFAHARNVASSVPNGTPDFD